MWRLPSAHAELDVVPKFIGFMSHSVVCNKLVRLIISQSLNQALGESEEAAKEKVFSGPKVVLLSCLRPSRSAVHLILIIHG